MYIQTLSIDIVHINKLYVVRLVVESAEKKRKTLTFWRFGCIIFTEMSTS